MEVKKIQLPPFTFSSYQLLLKALKYYLHSSMEFIVDDDVIMGTCEVIDYIERMHKEVNSKIKLPTMFNSTYELLLKALKYYMISSTEFLIDTDLSVKICNMIDYMQEEWKEVGF